MTMEKHMATFYALGMSDETARRLGARLREMRQAQGLTQEELCDRAGMSQPYLSNLERGMGWRSVSKLMDKLQSGGLDVSRLFGAEEPLGELASRVSQLLGTASDLSLRAFLVILEEEARLHHEQLPATNNGGQAG